MTTLLVEKEGLFAKVIDFKASELICMGYTSRNKKALLEHIEELKKIGVPAPEKIPTSYVVNPNILTTGREITVDGLHTSGEVEYVLLVGNDGETYITVGSDHTDRDLERQDILRAKNKCPKIMAPKVWPLREVEDSKQLVLTSWVSNGHGLLQKYQEAYLSDIMEPVELFREVGGSRRGLVLMSGTVPVLKKHIVYSDVFIMRLEDRTTGRRIEHWYQISVGTSTP
ncbi:MAG: DUF2848 family protein [Candidatus Caldarchaeum sp.]